MLIILPRSLDFTFSKVIYKFVHASVSVFSVLMKNGADSSVDSHVSPILPFQFPTEYCVCYVMSYPTLSWPHQHWVMPESRLFWLHSEGLGNVFIFRMRQEELSLISEEMEGRNCRCICHLWNTMHTIGKCLQITVSVLYFQVNHNCFRGCF